MAAVPLPKINPSPKTRFIGIKHCVDAHRDLLQRQDLITGLEQSMLEYVWNMCGGDRHGTLQIQAGEAASGYYKILGAHEFVKTFRNLAEVQAPPAAVDDPMKMSHI